MTFFTDFAIIKILTSHPLIGIIQKDDTALDQMILLSINNNVKLSNISYYIITNL